MKRIYSYRCISERDFVDGALHTKDDHRTNGGCMNGAAHSLQILGTEKIKIIYSKVKELL